MDAPTSTALHEAMAALSVLAHPGFLGLALHQEQFGEYRTMLDGFLAGRVKAREVLGRDHNEVYVDSAFVAERWIARQVIQHGRMCGAATVAPGERVLTWHTADEDSIRWDGVDPGDPHMARIRLTIGRAATEGAHLTCPAEDVAPAWMPLGNVKDPRIVLVNETKPAPWLAGRWHLTVPMADGRGHEKWFATKVKALRYARVWLAVLDFQHGTFTPGV